MGKISKSQKFVLTNGYRNFGYVIRDCESRKTLFHTSNAEQANDVFNTIDENHTDFPEPKKDWIPQLLIIEEKHSKWHYLITSPESLNIAAFEYLKSNWEMREEYNPFKKWDDSTNTELISQECINLCTNERIKGEMVNWNKAFNWNNKKNDEHNALIDNVANLMVSKDINSAYSLLVDCEFLYYNHELTTFDNHRTL